MNLLVPPRLFDPAVPEMMDRPTNDIAMLRDDLKNLRTINKYFGGLAAIRNSILPFFQKIASKKIIEILDLATGSGDHPVALVQLARRLQRSVRITALDANPLMLAAAKERVVGYPEIVVEQGDILSPRYAEKSFDIVLCSLAIHHFSREDAITILRQMKRLSRIGFIVNDLNRSWLGAWTVWLYTHLTTRNPMTLYDSYQSVLRAFTPYELAAMAREAGVQNFVVKKHPFFRLILVAEH